MKWMKEKSGIKISLLIINVVKEYLLPKNSWSPEWSWELCPKRGWMNGQYEMQFLIIISWALLRFLPVYTNPFTKEIVLFWWLDDGRRQILSCYLLTFLITLINNLCAWCLQTKADVQITITLCDAKKLTAAIDSTRWMGE